MKNTIENKKVLYANDKEVDEEVIKAKSDFMQKVDQYIKDVQGFVPDGSMDNPYKEKYIESLAIELLGKIQKISTKERI